MSRSYARRRAECIRAVAAHNRRAAGGYRPVGKTRRSGLPNRYPAGTILGQRVEDRSGCWIGLVLAGLFFLAALGLLLGP